MSFIYRICLLALFAPGICQGLEVVASSTSTGMLVREIAGNHARLSILAPPDRDLHLLQVRPSMMRALRSADLVTALGADIEIGWLPLAIQQAANPDILPGTRGYFEAAAQVSLLQVSGQADRALGDVHPVGNPHINMDPLRMAQVGQALAERLAELDPGNADDYLERAATFSDKVSARLQAWQAVIAGSPGAVTYHVDLTYLLDRFQVPLLGVLEPVPGIPPTAAHIKKLTDRLQGKPGVILFTTYQPERAPQSLARILDWQTVRLPLEPPLKSDGDKYLEHMDAWIESLAAAR
jgi:zinc/manganese transport system substrate-binding protein